MSLTELLGVLGFLLALVSLAWQIRSQRVRLRVKVDETKSDFVIGNMVLDCPEKDEREFKSCTALCLAISVANPSNRLNTVVRIDVVKPAARDLRSLSARVHFDSPSAVKYNRQQQPEWKPPKFLQAGSQHEAWSFHIVENSVWSSDTPTTIKVCAVDTHGREHCCRARLRHRPAENP